MYRGGDGISTDPSRNRSWQNDCNGLWSTPRLCSDLPLPLLKTKNRDHLESQLATALAEKEAEIKENLRVRENYEAIQKREVRLQSQLDLLRREMEDLQVTPQNLFISCHLILSPSLPPTHTLDVKSRSQIRAFGDSKFSLDGD